MTIRMLDLAETLPGAATARQRSYDLLSLREGAPVVDVGCGTGRAVADLAGRGARPVGFDLDAETVAEARRRWPALDLRVGDAYRLPLADGSVAGYRAEKVFHELADPERALAEAARVLEPGGTAVLLGQDWDTLVIDADDRALTRRIVRARADAVTNPWSARRYRNLLLAAGFTDPTVEVHTSVVTDATMLPVLLKLATAVEGADAWAEDQRARAANGRLFVAIPLFLAAARKA